MKTSTLLILSACAIAVSCATGCNSNSAQTNSDKDSKNTPGTDPLLKVTVLEPSFKSLVNTSPGSSDIPWQTALTLAEIANLTYDDEQNQISSIRKLGATEVRPIAVGLSHGVVASDENAVVIGFRGTTVASDWLTNTQIVGHRIDNGKIHRGFYTVVDAIYKKVFDEAVRQGAKGKKVWITGHSLGGAMAVVFAYQGVTQNELAPEGIITFGQPLALSRSLAQYFLDKFETKYIRFVNNWDAVPRLLPNYRHAGARVYMKADGFTFRAPVIALSAPANAPVETPPQRLFVEDEAELEPMTEDEFKAFQQQLEADKNPREAATGLAGAPVGMAISIPWYEAHLMSLYIDRIREFGTKETNSIGSSGKRLQKP